MRPPTQFRAIFLAALVLALPSLPARAAESPRLRLIVETDAGGDPDDEQSLVRFLLYCNEWDVEGIILTRPTARDGENLNPQRTGHGIAGAMLDAYAQVHPNLVQHDPRYPDPGRLREITVTGYADRREGVDLVRAAIDRDDPRPVWFCNWGTDNGSGTSNLRRALDEILHERGTAGYAKAKDRIRLSSSDEFGDHTAKIDPPFRLWVDTFRPEVDRKRWYHRFSAITATAGGFDIERDVRTGHGPLGALYPTNTTHPQKEGDSMTFLYLVPTGMNDPNEPTWGSWAGRYGPAEAYPGRPNYYWANQHDTWRGSTSRENTLARWAAHLQNDFRARMDWCVRKRDDANHPPSAQVRGAINRTVRAGERVALSAAGSKDPEKDQLHYEWSVYPEVGTYRGVRATIEGGDARDCVLVAPRVEAPATVHVILSVTDDGEPALTRYRRVILNVEP